MSLYLIRHGETTWNVEHRMQGQNNESKLTEKGRRESQELGQRLRPFVQGKEVEMWSSDLVRAHETAKIIAEELGISGDLIRLEPALRECNFGQFEGSCAVDYKAHPNFLRYQENQFHHAIDPVRGESYKMVAARAQTALLRIMERIEGKVVLVITHGGVMRSLQMVTLSEEGDPVRYREVPSAPNNAVYTFEQGARGLLRAEI
jgi:broad specificity phosphatase PhoE